MEQFRNLRDAEGNLLKHNFRPTQPIGDRIVWLTSNKFNHDDDLHESIQGQKSKKKKKGGKNCGCGTNFNLFVIAVAIALSNTHHLIN